MKDSRYSRQLLFQPIGEQGQERIQRSRVAIVGCGALGTVLSNHMVRAGVGFVRIIDRDYVEWSNLQRQMLFEEEDANRFLPKAVAAKEKLLRINSSIQIEACVADLTSQNAAELLSDVDLILDGSDNFQVRFLINDISVKYDIPWIYGGAVSSHGMSFVIQPGKTPCLRCLFESVPAPGTTPSCDTAGVIGPITDIIASLQAAEALKILVGADANVSPYTTSIDVWKLQTQQINITHAKRETCICCGKNQFDYLETSIKEQAVSLCGRNSIQILPTETVQLDLLQLEEQVKRVAKVESNRFLLRIYVDTYVLVVFPDGRVLIQGTEDIGVARSLYSKYIGM